MGDIFCTVYIKCRWNKSAYVYVVGVKLGAKAILLPWKLCHLIKEQLRRFYSNNLRPVTNKHRLIRLLTNLYKKFKNNKKNCKSILIKMNGISRQCVCVHE